MRGNLSAAGTMANSLDRSPGDRRLFEDKTLFASLAVVYPRWYQGCFILRVTKSVDQLYSSSDQT